MIINISEENYNVDLQMQDRTILTPSSAFGLLREELIKNIGIDRTKGFLIQYGWKMGENDAREAMKLDLSLKSLLIRGPIDHTRNGQISGIKYDGHVLLDNNQMIQSVYGKGIWIDSYEAMEHLKRFGLSENRVCHTLTGYASGYMSTVCGHKVIAKEVACIAKGDAVCRWEIRSLKNWHHQLQDELHFYSEKPIIQELEYTYEQLLEQKKYISNLSDIQKRLAKEIANGSNLQSITDIVYDLTKIPIVIEDLDFQTLAYSGLYQDDFMELKEDTLKYIHSNSWDELTRKEKQQLVFGEKRIRTALQERLIVPISVLKKAIGYCAFIYKNNNHARSEADSMLLDHVATAVSLILLNEKTNFESLERMKGNFLDQILNGHYSSNQEIISRGKYINLDLDLPFMIAVLGYESKTGHDENKWLLHEQVLEESFQYFTKQKNQILIGQRDGQVILLVMQNPESQKIMPNVLGDFIDFLEKTYDHCEFKIGFSSEGEQIEDALLYYEEAIVALRSAFQEKLVSFESLGIVGLLINTQNNKGIQKLAKQQLGQLYNFEDEKNIDLIKTLYAFLLNGGNLKQTMYDLSLSKSGLVYRIQKIESIMGTDLRNPKMSRQLLLILDALIALGELTIN